MKTPRIEKNRIFSSNFCIRFFDNFPLRISFAKEHLCFHSLVFTNSFTRLLNVMFSLLYRFGTNESIKHTLKKAVRLLLRMNKPFPSRVLRIMVRDKNKTNSFICHMPLK